MRVESFEAQPAGEHALNGEHVSGGNRLPQSKTEIAKNNMDGFEKKPSAKKSGTIAAGLLAAAVPGAVLSLLLGASTQPAQLNNNDAAKFNSVHSNVIAQRRKDPLAPSRSRKKMSLAQQKLKEISASRPKSTTGRPKSALIREVEKVVIPRATITLYDESMGEDETTVLNEGSDGERVDTYLIDDPNSGTRSLIDSEITLEAVSRVIVSGVQSRRIDGAKKRSTIAESEASVFGIGETSSAETVISNALTVSVEETGISSASIFDLSVDGYEIMDLDSPAVLESEIGNPASAGNISTASEMKLSSSSTKSSAYAGTWPSKSYSAFNFPNPGKTWSSDSSMGAGENYPGINKKAVSSKDATQGIEGPKAAFTFGYPLKNNYITSFFGWRKSYGRMHYGVDFRAAMKTPVYASARGTVTWYTKPKGGGSYGKVIELNHGDGFTSIYAHLDEVLVSAGDHVEKGDLIAYSGSSGAVAAHLHFEIRNEGIPYNPFMGYLEVPEANK